MSKEFVKSGDTSVPVSRSRAELERLLERYGCLRLSVQTDYARRLIIVGFVVRERGKKDAVGVPVRFEINCYQVYGRLFGRPRQDRWDNETKQWIEEFRPQAYNEKQLAQAERVAWRNLILWVDAALSAAACGMQTVEEAFLAHTLIRDAEGHVTRLVEHMDQAAGGNWRALLAPPEAS